MRGSRYRHGKSRTKVHGTWLKLRARCYDLNDVGYSNYGGRGITVDPEWRESFEAFYRDMGEPPTPRHSIDRVDNDGPYTKANCRWADTRTQCRNRRSNVRLTLGSKSQTLVEWSEELGLSQATLEHRVKRNWTVERTLTQPQRVVNREKKK